MEHIARLFIRPTLLAAALFFIPKINLLVIGGETAGIRLDDLALAAVAAYVFCSWVSEGEFKVDRMVSSCFAVVGTFCLSNALNLGHSNILYSVRILEYLVFLWVGQAFAMQGGISKLLKSLILVNCGLIILQAAHIIGAFTSEGYVAEVGRSSGLANHPAEMGAWLNLMFAALVFGGAVKFWRWSLLVFFCIILTGSRVSLFAQFILTMVFIYRSSKRKGVVLLRSAIIAGLLVSIVSFTPNPVSARSESVLSLDNLSTFKNLYDLLPVDTEFTGFADEDQPINATTDLSWWMRITKWTVVTKLYLNSSPMTRAIGIGPGALGPALDGGWLRLLVECGLLGFVVFAMMLSKIASLSTACSMMVLALSINMLLIDSHIAYKVMAFLFFFAGYTLRRNSFASPGTAP
jgi:hypothetical protein